MPNRITTRRATLLSAMLLLAFALPGISGLLARVNGSHDWFRDYEAVACAGEKYLRGEPLYDRRPVCAEMRPTPYVYPPLAAAAFGWATWAIGRTGLAGLYGALFWASVGFMLWASLFTRRAPGKVRERAPFLAFWPGGALTWGNLSVPLHAAVTLAALSPVAMPWLLALSIALGAMLKPVFLTYVVVFLYLDLPIAHRAGFAVATATTGAAPTLWFMLHGGAAATGWQGLLEYMVLSAHTGVGYFGWLLALGLNPNLPALKLLYFPLAALLALGGLALLEAGRAGRMERVWLGLTVGVLLNPRLRGQDMLLLGPGLLVMAEMAGRQARAWGPRVRPALVGICTLAAIWTLLGGSGGQKLAFAGFTALVIGLGAARWTVLRDFLRRSKRIRPAG